MNPCATLTDAPAPRFADLLPGGLRVNRFGLGKPDWRVVARAVEAEAADPQACI